MKHLKLFEDYNKDLNFDEIQDKETYNEFDYSDEWDDEWNDEFDEDEWDEEFEAKKSKPDFLDIDKDGNKKESMKKAAKDSKNKGNDKLTAAQRRLPAGLRAAIARKKSKGKPKD